MAMHVVLSQTTHYRHDRPLRLLPPVVRLRPAPHRRARALAYSQKIEPATYFTNGQKDPFASCQARLVLPDPTTEFKPTIGRVGEMAVYSPLDFFLDPRAENFPFPDEEAPRQELSPYLATELPWQRLMQRRTRPRRSIE